MFGLVIGWVRIRGLVGVSTFSNCAECVAIVLPGILHCHQIVAGTIEHLFCVSDLQTKKQIALIIHVFIPVDNVHSCCVFMAFSPVGLNLRSQWMLLFVSSISNGVRLYDLGRSYVSNVRLKVFQHELSKNIYIYIYIYIYASFAFYNIFMQYVSPSGCHTYVLHKCCVSAALLLFSVRGLLTSRTRVTHSRAKTSCFVYFKPSPGGSHRVPTFPIADDVLLV